MEQYLLDTNVVSHYFSNSFTNDGIQFMNTIFDSVPIISIISKIELLSWVTDKGTEKKVREFMVDSNILKIVLIAFSPLVKKSVISLSIVVSLLCSMFLCFCFTTKVR